MSWALCPSLERPEEEKTGGTSVEGQPREFGGQAPGSERGGREGPEERPTGERPLGPFTLGLRVTSDDGGKTTGESVTATWASGPVRSGM